MSKQKLLYHYTDAQGLLGILGTPSRAGSFWLSHVQYLNDESEYQHAYELARSEVIDLAQECPSVREILAGYFGIPHGDAQLIDGNLGLPINRIMVFSVSEEPDLLSQWRGYTPKGGYSIGFDKNDLQRFAAREKLRFGACVYDIAEKRELLRAVIRTAEHKLGEGSFARTYLHSADRSEQEVQRAEAAVFLSHNFTRLARLFKHPSFSEEREWRMVNLINIGDNRSRWRAKGNEIVPYAECPLGEDDICLFPVEIVIGPGIRFEVMQATIDQMTWGRTTRPKVRQSTIPYRG